MSTGREEVKSGYDCRGRHTGKVFPWLTKTAERDMHVSGWLAIAANLLFFNDKPSTGVVTYLEGCHHLGNKHNIFL